MKSPARDVLVPACHVARERPKVRARARGQRPCRFIFVRTTICCGDPAFTVIELLVVVAVIAILASLAHLGLSRAKSQVRSTLCKNNLRHLGMAVQSFAADNNGFYPDYQTREHVLWETALQSYYPVNWSNQLSQCPSYTGLLPGSPGIQAAAGGIISSYGYNTWGVTWGPVNDSSVNYCLGLGIDAVAVKDELVGRKHLSIGATLNHRESQISSPSDLFAFMDSRGSPVTVRSGNGISQAWAGWDLTDGMPVSKDDFPFLQDSPQHGAAFNVLSCDAHVESVPIADLFESAAASGPAISWKCAHQWNIDNQPHIESWLFN